MSARTGMWVSLLSLCLILALLTACDSRPPATTPGPADQTAPAGQPGPTAPPSGGEAGTPGTGEPGIPEPTVLTLTIWTTEALAPSTLDPAGAILEQTVAELEQTRPAVRHHFVLKLPSGKGGMLDHLVTTGAVVPALLPDLAFLDVDEIVAAVQTGRVQPLEEWLPAQLIDDLYPFARQACTVDGQLYCLQFQADLDHLVYRTNRMTRPPRTWSEVLARSGPYLFPAGGRSGLVNDAFWSQYLAIGPGAGQPQSVPSIEEQDLAAVLQFYHDGLTAGTFPADILSYHTGDDSWRAFLAERAPLAIVGARRYLAERGEAPASGVAPIPSKEGPGAVISRGWALLLITPDPARQAAALPFVLQWMSPEVSAAWNEATHSLPARGAALALWDGSDPYTVFLEEELLVAQPRPSLPNYTKVAAAIQAAVEAVLKGEMTAEAAAAAVLAVRP